MAKEKEASAPSCTFSCFEYLVSIRLRAQAFLNNFHTCEVFFERWHKEISLMKSHLNIRPVSYRICQTFSLFFFTEWSEINFIVWSHWAHIGTIVAKSRHRSILYTLCFIAVDSIVLNKVRHSCGSAPTVSICDLDLIDLQYTLLSFLYQENIDIVRVFKLVFAVLVDCYLAELWYTC